MTEQQTIGALKAAHGDLEVSEFRGQTRVVVPLESIHDVLKALKEQLGFDLLVDITCVDYLRYRGAKDRFGMVYLLANVETNERITVRTFLNDPEPRVPSIVDLWAGANWLEREVWDARARIITETLTQPGMEDWWKKNQHIYSTSFQEAVAKLLNMSHGGDGDRP